MVWAKNQIIIAIRVVCDMIYEDLSKFNVKLAVRFYGLTVIVLL